MREFGDVPERECPDCDVLMDGTDEGYVYLWECQNDNCEYSLSDDLSRRELINEEEKQLLMDAEEAYEDG